jgi:hypothetical protein
MQQQRESLAITWYTRRDGIVRGPFAPAHITRYILLGRIRLDDELSHDRITWRLTRSVATLLPAEMLNLHGWEDYQQLVEARMRVDERRQERRCAQCPNCANCHPERRSSPDRRKGDDSLLIDYFPQANSRPRKTRQPGSHRLRTLLLLLLAGLVFAWLVPGAR